MSKILNDQIHVPTNNFQPAATIRTREYQYHYAYLQCNCEGYQSSLFPSRIWMWNSLPSEIAISLANHNDFTINEKYYLNPTTSRLSLLLHESEAMPRMSVNNNDNLRAQWDLSGFYPMPLMCMIMASVHKLPLFFEVIYNLLWCMQ